MKPSKQFIRAIALLVLSYLSALGSHAALPDGYDFKNLTQAMQTAKAEGKPMLLYFGRYGCSSCLKMHNEVFTDPQLRQQLRRNFVLAYVDTESDRRIRLSNGERTTEQQFAARSRVFGTPTFIYFDVQQQPLFKKAGFQTIAEMRRQAGYVAGGHYRHQTYEQFMPAG